MRRRAPLLLLTVLVVLVALAAGLYLARTRSEVARPTGPPETSPPSSTARGEVTIDLRRQQLAGVRTVRVAREPLDHAVRVVGLVRYDETRLADVNVKVEGWIRDLYVDYTGQAIQKGQRLFTLYSPDLLATQNEYLLALSARDQLQQSTIPDARQRADALVASARQRLALWDLPAEDLLALEQNRQAQEAIVVRSPVDGFVIEKQALQGLHVVPGQSLYKVADLSTVWVEAGVYENELASLRLGQSAIVTVDAYPGEQFTGRIIYIYPYLDESTRTNRVRVAFANPGGRLKPGMYADVQLRMRGGTGVTVPTDAVLDSGAEQIVFVAQGEGRFEPRTVKTGRRFGDTTEILAGVKEGELVATGATFFLDSESQLRASLRGYQAATPPAGSAAAPRVEITFRALSDPPRTGENRFEATVKDAEGKPVDDAEVSVQFFMPAMPTMNMPAMRSEARLSPAGSGVYRGMGQLMTAGRWDVTVTVSQAGQRLGSGQFAIAAK